MARDPRLAAADAHHGNDAPAIACKARGTARNHAPLAITQVAFEAIASTLPLGSVGYENEVNERGERLIWLDRAVVSRSRAIRGHRESFRDVILRLASESVV